jgi:hypothetical protein
VGSTAIAAGWDNGYALAADGSISAWGWDAQGQVSNTPTDSGFTAIAADGFHAYALTAAGSIVAWGNNDDGQVSNIPTGAGFAAIAAGYANGYALLPDTATWTKLAGGTFGSAGQPTLTGNGSLEGGSQCDLMLTNAPPFELIVAWFSFAPTPYGLYGGTVWAHPFQDQQLFLSDATGAFHGVSTWPTGMPPGTEIWFQFYVRDPATFHGMCMSNGLLAVTP